MSEFQSCQFVFERSPDRISLWPEENQGQARRAVERLLEQNPGKSVKAEESYCIDRTNLIWPTDPVHEKYTHALLHRVSLA